MRLPNSKRGDARITLCLADEARGGKAQLGWVRKTGGASEAKRVLRCGCAKDFLDALAPRQGRALRFGGSLDAKALVANHGNAWGW